TARGVDGMVTAEGGGLRLRGRSDVGPGQPVLAAIRPDDVRMTDDAGGPGVAHGTIRLVEYQGREYDVEIALEAGGVLKDRRPPRRRACRLEDRAHRQGDRGAVQGP